LGEIVKYEIEVVKVSNGIQGSGRVKIFDVGERRFLCNVEIFNNYFKLVKPPKSEENIESPNSADEAQPSGEHNKRIESLLPERVMLWLGRWESEMPKAAAGNLRDICGV